MLGMMLPERAFSDLSHTLGWASLIILIVYIRLSRLIVLSERLSLPLKQALVISVGIKDAMGLD